LRTLPARLPPRAWLRLAAGFAVVVACGAVFAGILDAVIEGDDISRFDQPLTAYLAAHRTGGLTTLFRTLTTIGSAAVLIPLAALAAASLAWYGRTWRPLWITALALAGSQLLVGTIKLLVARPRPSAIFAVLTANGYSFPSGHATSSLAAFGILAWLTAAVVSHRLAQVIAWTIAILLALGVGLSRIYLGVHYLSDVLAAWALGAGWLTAVIAALTTAADLHSRPDGLDCDRNAGGGLTHT
jgi:undecaprenyl-diphosphatase